METTSMSCDNSLKKLCEQYDQEMADTEVDLDIHDKLIKLMKENRAINQQQFSSIQKNTEQTEKELQLLDEKTNELVQSTNLQGEKIEELKRVQQQIMGGISDAQNCLLAAQNTTRDDLEKLHSMEREAQNLLKSNLASSNFSNVASKLQNCDKMFSSKVQESIDYLVSVKSIADEANHLENLEEVLEEMRMDAANLEEQIGEIDAHCSLCHKKIVKLNMEQEEEKQRRNSISEKYKQRKRHIAELTRNLNIRKNDKKLLDESMNSKEQELKENEERFKKKNADAAAIEQEINTIKNQLAKLEDVIKFEREMHEQKVQEIKEGGEANICAIKSVLMDLREKESTMLMQIQQAHDDLNKKSELEAHNKINEGMERNLEQLKQEKAQLQLELVEKESRRSAQLSGMKAMRSAYQENKLEASKKREFLVEEVKRMSEQILGLKHKIREEERRLKAQRNAMDRQLKMVTVSKGIGTLICSASEKDGKSRQDGTEAAHGSLTKGSTSQGEVGQESEGMEYDKIEKSEGNVKYVKPEKSGSEEIIVRKIDPRKHLTKKNSASDEKMNSTSVLSEIKEPLLTVKRSDERGRAQISSAEQEESKFSQSTANYKACRQTRKKREQKKEQSTHNLAVTLFDSDVSASTIKPMCASTPLLQKNDESSAFYNDTVKATQKKRGRPKGKKAGRGTRAGNDNSKFGKKKDAYDLDSDFD
ncbi:hypothetical protein ACH3XW_39180 [Acanthocheilonema viteae]|uniref:Uncharacterized protein n=1 Tax=Acanthocheilonema viteae TaxID=6277 RepID=A0A498SK98_ACAVI|nr:unnamed protein product [Acanthocheilonema viteae]